MDFRAIAMGVSFALIWSSAFSSARIIVADAPPLAALALRFLISGVIGVAIARALGQSWNLTRDQWRATVIFGISQNALYLGLNFVAMQKIEASLAAIIASAMPLLVALAGFVFFRERLRPMAWFGLFAGLVGAVLLALASVLGESHEVAMSGKLVLAFAYTTLVPGLAATWIWFALVGRVGAVKAATFHFLNPFFGVAIAALILGETVRGLDIIGALVIGAGILIVQLSQVGSSATRI